MAEGRRGRRNGTGAGRPPPGPDVLPPAARRLLATGTDPTEAAPADTDWHGLLALALRERAVAPVWRGLGEPEVEAMPDGLADRFRAVAQVAEFRQRALASRLEESLRALTEIGVRPLLLKGAALAHDLYPDPADRPMFDLDLLVPTERASEAREALLRTGWRWRRGEFPDEMYRRHCHLPPLEDERGIGLALELHTDLFGQGHPFLLGGRELEREARVVRVGDVEARVPGPVEHLVYVCLHFSWSHVVSRGAWRTFRDVAVLAGAEGFSWDRFVEAARAARGGTCCFWTLELARELGDVVVPDRVLDALDPGLPGPARRLLRRHFTLELLGDERSCPSLIVRRWTWSAAIRPRRSGHGPSRPWSHEGDFVRPEVGRDEAEDALAAQIRRGAERLVRGLRYLRGLAGGGVGASGTGPGTDPAT